MALAKGGNLHNGSMVRLLLHQMFQQARIDPRHFIAQHENKALAAVSAIVVMVKWILGIAHTLGRRFNGNPGPVVVVTRSSSIGVSPLGKVTLGNDPFRAERRLGQGGCAALVRRNADRPNGPAPRRVGGTEDTTDVGDGTDIVEEENEGERSSGVGRFTTSILCCCI